MKRILTIVILIVASSLASYAQESIHQFTVTSIDGSEFNFADLKGKKVMVVNTASKCGLTPQYELLEALYQEYQAENFVIVGFPANNFLWQEPGTDQEIKEFCTKNYGVSFPMMSKISVKGDDIHPIYSWLTQKSENGVMDSKVKWNFQKYLIDEDGKLVDVLSPKEKPNCEKVILWLQQ
ncbi:glutathione peroxidase [Labilibaculum antarcticum]|uniref:Glutathione peroxidase n=1 Tax=Labilibaculum antarcticum TaxID=1717717 RepID=A0A1Y1CLX9_9BACT|nr:glutathione peroxidase [Labilibaculum antarcticum]BAX81300.1 glutathione peroxidase [Labilibaculum antarcticum]